MRTNNNQKPGLVANDSKKLMALASALVTRMNISARLGQQYAGKRSLYDALGYKRELDFNDYVAKYTRLDVAKAVIDRPVGATWRGILDLEEVDTPEDTEFETAWEELRKKYKLKNVFTRVDKLSQIGKYAIILFGFSDNTDVESFMQPVKKGAKLKYIKVYSEESVKIGTYETDQRNVRYGLPKTYSINSQDASEGPTSALTVHYSRVLHVISDPLESEVEGTPSLEVIFNRLMDLEKIVGGDGEMFWRGARPGFNGNVNKEYAAGPQTEDELMDQIEGYENDLRRILITEGVELKPLAQQIASPKEHVDVQMQMIAAVKGIPLRILTGSERGELSSAQDSEEWRAFIQERREEHAQPQIVEPFVEKMIELGILPEPSTGTYKVKWPNVFDLNPKDKAEIGKNRAAALKDYSTNPIAQTYLPPPAMLKYILALDPDEVTLIEQQVDSSMQEEALQQQLFPPTPVLKPLAVAQLKPKRTK